MALTLRGFEKIGKAVDRVFNGEERERKAKTDIMGLERKITAMENKRIAEQQENAKLKYKLGEARGYKSGMIAVILYISQVCVFVTLIYCLLNNFIPSVGLANDVFGNDWRNSGGMLLGFAVAWITFYYCQSQTRECYKK